MKLLSSRTKWNIMVLLILFVVYLVVTVWLKLPWYILLLAYITVFAVMGIVSRKNLFAVMGNLYFASAQAEKAKILFEKAIEMGTTNASAYLNYAIMLVREGDWEKSLKHLEKAESLSPDVLTEKSIYLTKGSCYWLKNDVKKAIHVLEELRSKYEYVNENVLVTLGYLYFLDDNMDLALELTQKAIEEAPQTASAWDNLGQIYHKKGDIEKAKEAYEKALSINSNLVDSLYYLGEIYEREGFTDKARELFAKAADCSITALNTVKKEQIQAKCESI